MSMYGPDPYFEPPPATIGEAEELAAREWAHREGMLPYEIARLGQTAGGLPGAQMARLEELGAHLQEQDLRAWLQAQPPQVLDDHGLPSLDLPSVGSPSGLISDLHVPPATSRVPVQPFSEKLRQANEIALAMDEATQDDCDAIDAAVGELLHSVLVFDDDVAQQIERMLREQIELRLRQEREAAEYRQWFESLSTDPPPQGGQSAPTGATPIFDSLSQQQPG